MSMYNLFSDKQTYIKHSHVLMIIYLWVVSITFEKVMET